VADAGLTWVGPPPEVLELAGDKVAAREALERTGFPVLPGAGPFTDPDAAVADGLGFPVMQGRDGRRRDRDGGGPR
jgi:biotin carboxylase